MGERMSAAEIGNELLREGCSYDLVARVRGELNARDAEIADLRAKLAPLVEAAHWAVRDSLRGYNARGGMVRTDTIKQLRQALAAAKGEKGGS